MSKLQSKLHFQRFEFKYYLSKSTADKLIPALLKHMDWDPYLKAAGQDYYPVNSLYFDSPDWGCYWDKEAGVGRRKKLRLRFYQRTFGHKVFLEMKRKNDALVTKDRIELEISDCGHGSLDSRLNQLVLENKNDSFLRELIWFKKRNCMRPKLFVSYKRKALVGKKEKKLRVTFDYDIKAKLANYLDFEPDGFKPVYAYGVVLEIKYNNVLPNWLARIIQKYQLERTTYSKYCNSVRTVLPKFDDHNYFINSKF